jgi:hypothetical protein
MPRKGTKRSASSFPPTETSSEFLQTDVSPEMPQPGQRSDDLRPFLAQESEPNFPLEGERISDSIPEQVSELPKPPDPRPPMDSPEVAAPPVGRKGQTPIGRRSDSAFSSTPVNRPESPPPLRGYLRANKLPGYPAYPNPYRRILLTQIMGALSPRRKNLFNQASTRIRSSGVFLC